MNAVTGRPMMQSASKPTYSDTSIANRSGLNTLYKAMTIVFALSSGLPAASCLQIDPCPKGKLLVDTSHKTGKQTVGVPNKMKIMGVTQDTYSGILCVKDEMTLSDGRTFYSKRFTQYENGKETLDTFRVGIEEDEGGLYSCSPTLSDSSCQILFHSIENDYLRQSIGIESFPAESYSIPNNTAYMR